jgi:hypothetical protein
LEDFHRHLGTFITTKQSSFTVILSELKNEQTMIENKLFFSLLMKKTNVNKMEENIRIYEELEYIEYLQNIALIIDWKLD